MDRTTRWQALFDGVSTDGWRMSTIRDQANDDPGRFRVVEGALEADPGNDLGLLWHTTPLPADFVLRLQFRRLRADDNSGVFVRFPQPDSKGYRNTAWVGIHFGFEVQIEDLPDRLPIHRTGALYDLAGQTLAPISARPLGTWVDLEVSAIGQHYRTRIDGAPVASYTNPDPERGTTVPNYVGLQTHTGRVQFRGVEVRRVGDLA